MLVYGETTNPLESADSKGLQLSHANVTVGWVPWAMGSSESHTL